MKKKKIIILSLIATAIYSAIFFIPSKNVEPEILVTETIPAGTSDERINYFALHGWEVNEIAEKDIIIPSDFSGNYEEYVTFQESQNLPLRNYAGKNAHIYVYEVLNFRPENKNILAELIVYDNNVVASMIYSEDGGKIRLSVN